MTDSSKFSVEFSFAMAEELFSKDDKFPVDFDDAWKWIGYSTKQKALQSLKSNFVSKEDFLTNGLKSTHNGRSSKRIMLTIDCFKMFGMMAGTVKGKAIRRYFLDCEKIAKRPTTQLDRLLEGITREPKKWECHFSPEWIASAESLTGWDWNWSCMGQFINQAVYDVLPPEFRQRLNEVNPRLESGHRANKHHQHVEESIDQKALKKIIEQTYILMETSESRSDFERRHKGFYGKGFQLTLTIGGSNA